MTPIIFAMSGLTLTPDERALFRDADPAGYILFARNIDTPDQVRALTEELRSLSGNAKTPILVDQEGGRVQRLGPPHWPVHPPAKVFGNAWLAAPMTAIEAARYHAQAIGNELKAVGIDTDCLPLLDVVTPGAHEVIGDRSFGPDQMMVAALGAAIMEGLREARVTPIMKHVPGHGRAAADSHAELPVVTATREELATDIYPFERLNRCPMAMTAHVRYDAIDTENCASLSSKVIAEVIRDEIGFDGLLMCDDLTMSALDGSLSDRMAAALRAGCDCVLHCSGDFAEMDALTNAAPNMSPTATERLAAAVDWAGDEPTAFTDAAARRDALLASLSV
ncbi:MAG: beta-N-acetylhexosaminidase [Pacificimonas sp.]